MRSRKRVPKLAAWLLVSAWGLSPAVGADHGEAPLATADPAADIADYYAWHTASSFVAVVTYAGLLDPSASAVYDADVLYGVHIDTDADNAADIDVWIRFGQDGDGNWGIQALNVPGASGPVEGAIETTVAGGTNVNLHAGLRDDPFFFDLEGFQNTLSTGTLSFDSSRDSVAGLNAMAIVVEMDLAAIGATEFQSWATTSRIGN